LSLSVVIACEHGLVRHALGSLLRRQPGVEVAAETGISAGLTAEARSSGANIVLITVESAESAVSPLLRQIYRDLNDIPVVLLNLADDDERLLDALSLGVRGIIDKNADGARLTESIREVLAGEITISKRLASRLVLEYVSSNGERPRKSGRAGLRSGNLSDRELEVLSRLARGEANKKIAERMYISVHTVRAHVRSLMQKLHVQNRVQAATYALKHGLVQPAAPEPGSQPDVRDPRAIAGGRR
jgi:two-component system NarL family response regulator